MRYPELVKQGKSLVKDLKKIRYEIAVLCKKAKELHGITYGEFAEDIGMTGHQIAHIMKEYRMLEHIDQENILDYNSAMKVMGHIRRFGIYNPEKNDINELYKAYNEQSQGFHYYPKLVNLRKFIEKNEVNDFFIDKVKNECLNILNILDKNKEESAWKNI